ncbi:hypothetical protein [Mycetocola zhadangensis]|uniref:DUF3955 domain-containing protein n=1 Tax=Mycetocola zhadangensis TaxID=1164595 RepID=A0A3L7J727_9MICO|nr:hypothetical protein [Mycetocola zhadangensis]RLQ86165.1 hypothetical protein D9V28_04845 [Mycetocola zhadangensis]GGE88936.1 hypothetical protein GCM10011313_09530 [Mycetocola zhadangensis]
MSDRKHWLDVIAPVRKGARTEGGAGLLLVAVVAFGLGIYGLFQPPGEMSTRLPIPYGVSSPLLLLFAVWCTLLAINVFRRARQR